MRQLLLAFFVAGCVDTIGPDLDCSDGKCDQPNASFVDSGNPNLIMYSGYTPLFDKSSSQCVTPDKQLANGAQVAVGNVSEKFELVFVTSREELAREMGLDLGVQVKYPLTSIDLGLDLVRSFKSTSTTTNLLLKLGQQYSVINRHPMLLTDTGQSKLAAGIERFVQTCGSHYVNGFRYGGQLFVMISYEAADEQTALDVKASLGVQAGVVAKVDVQLKTRLAMAASQAGVTVTVHVASQGFAAPGGQPASSSLIADVIGTGISAQTFTRIDELRELMRKSIALDACLDAGAGACEGQSAPGFFNNTRRNARPIGVDLGFYDTLPNLEFSGVNPFKRVTERMQVIERFTRDWSALEDRMTAVFRDELEPFQQASASGKAAFQLAPPANRLRDPSSLVAINSQWSGRFSPPVGSRIGTTFQRVRDALQGCWNAASLDLFASCAPDGVMPQTTGEWRAAAAELADYAATGRILPLQVRPATIATRGAADAACQSLSTPRLGYRLPTLDEARLLSPLVGFGAVDWGTAQAHTTWFFDPSNTCSGQLTAWMNDPADFTDHASCFGAADTLRVLCVPLHGPLPLAAAP